MEIILLEKVHNLGNLGDTVNVANGYARNFLIPQNKAVRATESYKKEFAARREELAAADSKRVEAAKARAASAVKEIKILRQVKDIASGSLYGSVANVDIVAALEAVDCKIDKSEISLPAGAIKNTGEYVAEIRLHPEVQFSLKVVVAAENPQTSPGE